MNLKNKISENPVLISRKRLRLGKYENVDKAVELFVNEAKSNNLAINGKIIQEKAKQYGSALNCNSFNASNGWFTMLMTRAGLKRRCLTGDAAEVDKTVADEWVEMKLKPILRVYSENDILTATKLVFFINEKWLLKLHANFAEKNRKVISFFRQLYLSWNGQNSPDKIVPTILVFTIFYDLLFMIFEDEGQF